MLSQVKTKREEREKKFNSWLTILYEKEGSEWGHYMRKVCEYDQRLEKVEIFPCKIDPWPLNPDDLFQIGLAQCKLLILTEAMLEVEEHVWQELELVLQPASSVLLFFCGVWSAERLYDMMPESRNWVITDAEKDTDSIVDFIISMTSLKGILCTHVLRDLSRLFPSIQIFKMSSIILSTHANTRNTVADYSLASASFQWHPRSPDLPPLYVFISGYLILKKMYFRRSQEQLAFQITPGDVNTLDKLLTDCLRENVPVGGLHLFGITHSEEEEDSIESQEELPTLLHFAARFGLSNVMAQLLQYPGAFQALRTTNKHGLGPSHLAETHGFLELQQFINDYLVGYTSFVCLFGLTFISAYEQMIRCTTDKLMRCSLHPGTDDDLLIFLSCSFHFNIGLVIAFKPGRLSIVYIPIRHPRPSPNMSKYGSVLSMFLKPWHRVLLTLSHIIDILCYMASYAHTDVKPQWQVDDVYGSLVMTPGQEQLIHLQEQVKLKNLTIDEALSSFKAWQNEQIKKGDSFRSQKVCNFSAALFYAL
uniref:Uncharacterized protein n=1 Tax=Eptatretus burgeri TaxID=7764 RepID=A0A8C4Q0M7_EPTBU